MKLLKKTNNIVAIFAHPDDEAFGPSGTLIKLARQNDLYILCATRGENGGDHEKLAEIRSGELKKSARLIGAKGVYFLGFKDGTLSNSIYHQLAAKIEKHLKRIKPEILITYEPQGISGHIDHITVSMVTTFVFTKLPFVKTLMYYCLLEENKEQLKDYFIYFPPGYKKTDIDEVVNVEDVWELKVKAMYQHKSQIADAKRILKRKKNLPKEEYFKVLTK